MAKNIDLVNGPVLPSLTGLALPIMATSLIQMAYNLTDMLWIGRMGSSAVASVGAAGMYMWLSNGLADLPKMGGPVNAGWKTADVTKSGVIGAPTFATVEKGQKLFDYACEKLLDIFAEIADISY